MATKKNKQKSDTGSKKTQKSLKKMTKMALRIRRKCSRLSAERKNALLQSSLKRIKSAQ
jgi:hypothetical protein